MLQDFNVFEESLRPPGAVGQSPRRYLALLSVPLVPGAAVQTSVRGGYCLFRPLEGSEIVPQPCRLRVYLPGAPLRFQRASSLCGHVRTRTATHRTPRQVSVYMHAKEDAEIMLMAQTATTPKRRLQQPLVSMDGVVGVTVGEWDVTYSPLPGRHSYVTACRCMFLTTCCTLGCSLGPSFFRNT